MYTGSIICMSDVINELKLKGYNMKNAVFSYARENGFIYCGRETSDKMIPLDVAIPHLVLKIRNAGNEQQQQQQQQEEIKEAPVQEKKNHSRRNKERRIGEIIEKVNDWRTLYTGTIDHNGKSAKYSLEDAAKIVGIAKKTLDDYLLQLRAGKKYGFDFQKHKDDKVGTLRSFVKEMKKKEKNDQSTPDKDDGQPFA